MILDIPKIQKIMIEKEITQSDIARKMRVSRQSVNQQFLRGTCNINRAHRYADILGVPVTEILTNQQPVKVELAALIADFNAQIRQLSAKIDQLTERVWKSDL